jgi:hypothetical protein
MLEKEGNIKRDSDRILNDILCELKKNNELLESLLESNMSFLVKTSLSGQILSSCLEYCLAGCFLLRSFWVVHTAIR